MADETEGGRKLRTKERKKYVDQEIDEDDIDGRRTYSVEEKLNSTKFTADMVQELKGPEFTMEWMQKNGLTRPIVFYDKTGLGLRVPSENFKVSDVKQCVGSRRILDVMDVTTQKAMEMAMKDWVKYYENPERDRLLNVISLEFCHTRLENYVESPTLVRQIDWVDRAWPRHLKECQTESTNVIERMKYPKVQKYCLMSVAGCYTDFHIDFGGTSVWYHILHGEKIFWLAPPSPKNIDRYVEWTLSAKQGDTFLGDVLEQCQRINLHAGYTFIIPSGWIHAVYTPKDSLVFGGNFLHSFNIENQLLVSRIEDKTYVPAKFRYPFFSEIMWYVLDRYISCLTGRTYLASCEKDELEDDDQGLIQVDEDSRPPSRNPDSRPPSRAMDDSMDGKVKSESGEDTPKLSKSVTIELTRIDAALRRSQSEDENQPPQQSKARVPRKAVSDPNSAWEGGGGPRKWIHLTVTEMRGLRQMVDYLNGLMALPPNKRGIPKDMVDPEAVLKEIRQILEDHKNDDQELAVSGDPVIGWPESARKKQQKLKLGYKTFKTAKVKGQTSGSSSSIRRRRTRCKQCEACTRTECGECTFCKDMKKFGGPGRMKQTCISRQCMAPILPSSSVCMICNQEGQPNPDDPDDVSMLLMECGICWEIVHPSCLQKKYENLDNEGAVNEDLPNSWECSKCCNEGKQGQLKPRIRPGTSTKRIKTEDHRLSADSDGSQEEEPMSPISPVEGKRVVSKEGSGSRNSEPYIKTEHGSIKWPSPPKKLTSYADVKVKTEEDASASSSPSRDDSLRKRSQPTSAQKDLKKHVKKEKTSAPNSPSSLQQEEARNPRKRPAVTPGSSGGKGSPIHQMDGGKRPKRETNTSSVCAESVTDGEEMYSAPRASNSTVTSGSSPSGITTRSNGKHRGRGSSTAVSNSSSSSSSKSSSRNPRSSTFKRQCNTTSVTAETKIPGTSQKRVYITANNRYADAQRLLRASTAVSVHTKKTNFPGTSKKKNFLSVRDKAAAAAGLIRVVKTPQNIFDKFTNLCPSLKSVPSPSSSSSSLKNATSISPCSHLKSISSPSTNNRNRFVNRPMTANKNAGAVTNTMKSSHVNSSDPGTKLSPQTDVTSSVIISPSTFSSPSVCSSLSSSTSPSSLSSSLSSSAVSQPLAAPQKSSVIPISPPLFLKPRAGCPRVTVRKSPVSGRVTVRKSPVSSVIKGMKIIHVKTTVGPRTAANPHASISSPCPNTDPITTSSKHNTAVKTNTRNTDLTTNSADPITDSTKYSTNTNSSTTTILSTTPTTSTSPNSVSTKSPTSASLSLGPSPSCPLSPPISPTSPTSSGLHHPLPNQSITYDHAYCKMKAENNSWEPASYVKTSF